jgi:hypothetical protein
MKALSILQPWAWLIVNGHKDIENRSWSTTFRGDILVHAGKRWGREQREDLAYVREAFPHIALPEAFDLGGIVGAVSIVDCVSTSSSPWFNGPFGFALKNGRTAPRFVPWKGQLGFFYVPSHALTSAKEASNG